MATDEHVRLMNNMGSPGFEPEISSAPGWYPRPSCPTLSLDDDPLARPRVMSF